MPILSVDGAELYYECHGTGPAVVFAHGMGGNHAIWYQQVDSFIQSNQVILFDHRGFGNSVDKDGRGRSAFVSDLTALLDHLNIEKGAFVGQSMGAGTVIGFAAQNPHRVAALGIADSLHGLMETDDIAPLMNKARASTADLDMISRVLGQGYQQSNPQGTRLYQMINSFNATRRANIKGRFIPIPPDHLAELGIPTLFIAGMEDRLFPIDAIRTMQAKITGSFLVEISGAGHSAFFERPTEFNDSLLSLLQMAGHAARVPTHSNAAGYVVVTSS